MTRGALLPEPTGMLRSTSLAALSLVTTCSALGCGAEVAVAIDDQPICQDYTERGARMSGGLRTPVALTVFDGKDKVAGVTLHGVKSAGDAKPTITLREGVTYRIEWAQCKNQRPSWPADAKPPAWACSEPVTYKTETFTLTKGDTSSRKLMFPIPPEGGCRLDDAPFPPPPFTSVVVPAPQPPAPASAAPR